MMRYSTIERHVTKWENSDVAPEQPWRMAQIFRSMDEAVNKAWSNRDLDKDEYNLLYNLRMRAMDQLSVLLPCQYYSLLQLQRVSAIPNPEKLASLLKNDQWKDRPILLGKAHGKPYKLLDGIHRLYSWRQIGGNVRVPAVEIAGDFPWLT